MKIDMKKIYGDLKRSLSKNSPQILTGIGIAGMVTTTILAVKATPKVLDLVSDAEYEKGEELTTKETVKVAWKCYVPAVLTCSASIACLIGAQSVNAKRSAALATAYKLSQTALSEYRDAVIETIGEKKEQVVRDKMAEKKLENNPVSKNDVIVIGKDSTLCYDSFESRYFKSDIDKIKKAVNEINNLMLNENYVSLNDFYDALNLDHSQVGDVLGWKIDDGLIELYFSAQLADDGTPCVAFDYNHPPVYDYNRFA